MISIANNSRLQLSRVHTHHINAKYLNQKYKIHSWITAIFQSKSAATQFRYKTVSSVDLWFSITLTTITVCIIVLCYATYVMYLNSQYTLSIYMSTCRTYMKTTNINFNMGTRCIIRHYRGFMYIIWCIIAYIHFGSSIQLYIQYCTISLLYLTQYLLNLHCACTFIRCIF